MDNEQLLTSVCYCYVQKHAMTVSNVAIAQSLAIPTCKSQLKLTQELHFYYQMCSMQHTLFIILFSFALLRFFPQDFFYKQCLNLGISNALKCLNLATHNNWFINIIHFEIIFSMLHTFSQPWYFGSLKLQ